MDSISPTKFRKLVAENPFWVREVLEAQGKAIIVKGFCNLNSSPIAYLSRSVHFRGTNNDGAAADFIWCENLKVARGTFYGSVRFDHSGVEEIDPENFKIVRGNLWDTAASFENCEHLKVATGPNDGYPARVSFAKSGVTMARNLKVNMPALKPSPDELAGKIPPRKHTISINFCDCNLQRLPKNLLDDPTVLMDPTLRKTLAKHNQVRTKLKKISKATLEF